MSAPLFSVVIPTFRRHETLRVVLERLTPERQGVSPGDFEIIVSDDAAFSETRALVQELAPRARWVAGPARGPAANRNAGARAAVGEWLVFTDDDTEPEQGWLAAYQRSAMEGTTVLEGRTICRGGFGSPMQYAPVNETGGLLWSCNFAVRRSLFAQVSGFDEGFTVPHMEDQDLRIRLLAAGAALTWVPDALVNHPPRRLPPAGRLGALREAEVRFHYKHGAPRPVASRLLRDLLSLRLGIIRSEPKSVDTLLALASLVGEASHVLFHLPAWERRYAQEFP